MCGLVEEDVSEAVGRLVGEETPLSVSLENFFRAGGVLFA